MAEATAGLSFKDVRASMKRMQSEGEKLVARLRRDARALSDRSRRDAVTSLLNDARRLRTDLRKRAEKAIRDLEARRARIVTTLEQQVTSIAESVVGRLNVATRDDVAELRRRIADVERRIEAMVKERAA
jgi:hypothetical protein